MHIFNALNLNFDFFFLNNNINNNISNSINKNIKQTTLTTGRELKINNNNNQQHRQEPQRYINKIERSIDV